MVAAGVCFSRVVILLHGVPYLTLLCCAQRVFNAVLLMDCLGSFTAAGIVRTLQRNKRLRSYPSIWASTQCEITVHFCLKTPLPAHCQLISKWALYWSLPFNSSFSFTYQHTLTYFYTLVFDIGLLPWVWTQIISLRLVLYGPFTGTWWWKLWHHLSQWSQNITG